MYVERRKVQLKPQQKETGKSGVERHCTAFAKTLGILSIKQEIGQGWPDRIFVHPHGTFFVEFKRAAGPRHSGGRLTPLQVRRLEALRNLGAEVHVIDSLEAFKDIPAVRRLMGDHA